MWSGRSRVRIPSLTRTKFLNRAISAPEHGSPEALLVTAVVTNGVSVACIRRERGYCLRLPWAASQPAGSPADARSAHEGGAVQIEEHAEGDRRGLGEFDFHGAALDVVFADYREMHARCPVGRSSKYGGFTFISKLEDIFAAEQHPD